MSGRDVQPTLERAWHWCGIVRAAGFLKSGLALARGSGPESAGGFLRGALTCRPGHPVCGLWRSAASESAVVPSTMLGSRSRNAWPARPRPVVARQILGPRLTPRISPRAERRSRTRRPATGLGHRCAAVLVIEIDSIPQIGPMSTLSRVVAQQLTAPLAIREATNEHN